MREVTYFRDNNFDVLFTVSAFYEIRKYKKTKWKENVIKETL